LDLASQINVWWYIVVTFVIRLYSNLDRTNHPYVEYCILGIDEIFGHGGVTLKQSDGQEIPKEKDAVITPIMIIFDCNRCDH